MARWAAFAHHLVTMRTIVISALIALVALALAPAAGAESYMTKTRAERYVRDFWQHKQGFRYAAATCRPQGMRSAPKGRRYDRWECGFAVGMRRGKPSCTGGMLIMGAPGAGRYLRRIDYQRGDCKRR
jgi:hypothetical protein